MHCWLLAWLIYLYEYLSDLELIYEFNEFEARKKGTIGSPFDFLGPRLVKKITKLKIFFSLYLLK